MAEEDFDSSGIDRVVIALQNDADIRAYIHSGLTAEEVILLFQYRAKLISLIAELLESIDDDSPEYSFDFYMDLIARDIQTPAALIENNSYGTELDRSVNGIISALDSMELDISEELRKFTPSEWESEATELYETYASYLPPIMVARETATQLIDLDQGTGVWVHSPE